jgi:DNA-binding NarL/FixJ family response regulator
MSTNYIPNGIKDEARKLCTHTIVFRDPMEQLVVARALAGRTTASIAEEFGLTESQVTYRIVKAQRSLGARFRYEYRHGSTPLARAMAAATERMAIRLVTTKIMPKFRKLARPGVPR